MKWHVETRVEDTKGVFHKDESIVSEKDEAIREGAKFVRKFYKLSWSSSVVEGHTSVATAYHDHCGIVGYVNVWLEEG